MKKGWAVVTGSAKGLGKELALECARLGWNVAVHASKSLKEAHEVQSLCQKLGVSAQVITADFTSKTDLDTFASQCKKLDGGVSLLINNVGVYHRGPSLSTTYSEALEMFQANVLASLELTKQFQKTLKNIISIGSAGVGYPHADTYAPIYHASKLALLMQTRSLAKELLPLGIRVNMVSPGAMENSVDLKEGGLKLPMHRPVSFQEVVSVVRFLLSDEARYITGQNIEVSGGFRLL